MKNFAFVIVAGGTGKRALPPSLRDTPLYEGGGADGGSSPKQFRLLGSRPMWLWSAVTACRIAEICEIVIVSHADYIDEMKSVCERSLPRPEIIKIVPGGAERADSVRNGLFSCVSPFVMIHDAARPFASEALLRRLMAATDERTGAIPLLPITDAVKKIHHNGTIEPVERAGLFITQTPQSFPRIKLIEALTAAKRAGLNPKDEAEIWLPPPLRGTPLWEGGFAIASLLEGGGGGADGRSLVHVEGDRFNFKITYPEDFTVAEAIAKCIEQE